MPKSKKRRTLENLDRALQNSVKRTELQFTQIDPNELVGYPAFLIGNDVPLSKAKLEPFSFNSSFIFVGTSVFRSVDFACKLAKNESILPKVIIVDNSTHVHEAWRKLQKFFNETKFTDPEKFLHDEDEGLLEFILEELHEHTRGMNPVRYFDRFFKQFSIPYVKKIIASIVLLRQDWGNEQIFREIKAAFGDRSIVAYPSNIIGCCNTKGQIRVLRSLQVLQPTLCIYSDLHPEKRVPTYTHIMINPTASQIADALKLEYSVCKAVQKDNDVVMEDRDTLNRNI